MPKEQKQKYFNPRVTPPLHIPDQKWEEISMDFIDGLPPSEGKDKILVVVNWLTKFAHFMEIKEKDTEKQIADVFCKNVYKLHGFPKVIVSDIDANFNGKIWREFFKQVGTSLNMSSAYHPQTDGQHTTPPQKWPPFKPYMGMNLQIGLELVLNYINVPEVRNQLEKS